MWFTHRKAVNMEYIEKKAKNISEHGQGCFCDYYRLQGYCKGKGFIFEPWHQCANRPHKVTAIAIYKDEKAKEKKNI